MIRVTMWQMKPRWGVGAAVAVLGLAALTAGLLPIRRTLPLATVTLSYLLLVVAVAVLGGLVASLAAAVASNLAVNWFFMPPFHTFAVDSRDNLVTLLVYVLVAATVGFAVEIAARQRTAAVAQAAHARELSEIDHLRAALLAAVGHDLRTPLASIKAAVSSLRQPDVSWSDDDRAELEATIEESADRLDDIVANLLAMTRLEAGVLSVSLAPVALDEAVAKALLSVPGPSVTVAVPEDLPRALADGGLLERVIVNLVTNARRATPSGVPLKIAAFTVASEVRLRVIDRGPGVAPTDRERIFAPFSRLDDRTSTGGLGLGLAIARGFTEAMGGTLNPSTTPGGGLTMTVSLPSADTP